MTREDRAIGAIVAPAPALTPDDVVLDADPPFAIAVAARAAELGLTYLAPTGARPIAVALPGDAEPDDAVRVRAHVAKVVLSALVKVGEAALTGALGADPRAALLAGLSAFEQHVLSKPRGAAPRIVTARADILIDVDSTPRVVEMNTTIPAMQGYSDIAVRAWAEVFLERTAHVPRAAARRLAAEAMARTGTNADDMLDALLHAYALDGGSAACPSIALVHRAGDSQLGELCYLAEQFRARGHDARTVIVDELQHVGEGRLAAAEFRPDILYRHIFARLLDVDGAFARALADPTRHHVYNPITAHLEQKAALAALSSCAADEALSARVGLDEEERAVVQRHVPWTRVLDDDIAADVVRAPERFVIKQSWDFGGKSVVLGARDDRAWSERVHAAVAMGGYVAQERVTMKAHPHLVAVDGAAAQRALFVDASSYTTFGTKHPIAGAVKRASTSPIVNIQSGGGIMPVVCASLVQVLVSLAHEHGAERPASSAYSGGPLR